MRVRLLQPDRSWNPSLKGEDVNSMHAVLLRVYRRL